VTIIFRFEISKGCLNKLRHWNGCYDEFDDDGSISVQSQKKSSITAEFLNFRDPAIFSAGIQVSILMPSKFTEKYSKKIWADSFHRDRSFLRPRKNRAPSQKVTARINGH
jgi:hypothetical protein